MVSGFNLSTSGVPTIATWRSVDTGVTHSEAVIDPTGNFPQGNYGTVHMYVLPYLEQDAKWDAIRINATVTAPQAPSATLQVVKHVNPSNDPGRFNLVIDNSTRVANVGDGGSTDAIPVDAGQHNVAEEAGISTSLSDYNSSISCKNGSTPRSRPL